MSETLDILKHQPQGTRTWSGRFNVRAQITYHSRRGKSGVMQVITYQPDMAEEEYRAILGEIGIQPDATGWALFVSQAKDTFSSEQADALVAYLNAREGTRAYRRDADLPTPGQMGVSAIPTLPSFRDGLVYRLFTERGYDLPFKVEAINIKTYLYMARLVNELRQALDKNTTGDS